MSIFSRRGTVSPSLQEYKEQPYVLEADEWSEYVEFLTRASSRKSVFFMEPAFKVDYEPGESHSGLFGGNSNWRGPVWMPGILIFKKEKKTCRT